MSNNNIESNAAQPRETSPISDNAGGLQNSVSELYKSLGDLNKLDQNKATPDWLPNNIFSDSKQSSDLHPAPHVDNPQFHPDELKALPIPGATERSGDKQPPQLNTDDVKTPAGLETNTKPLFNTEDLRNVPMDKPPLRQMEMRKPAYTLPALTSNRVKS